MDGFPFFRPFPNEGILRVCKVFVVEVTKHDSVVSGQNRQIGRSTMAAQAFLLTGRDIAAGNRGCDQASCGIAVGHRWLVDGASFPNALTGRRIGFGENGG
jgi:hypothetical protein